MSYALSITLDVHFNEAVSRITTALTQQGFEMLTAVDLQEVLKEKAGAVVPRQLLMGVLRPQLAVDALRVEPSMALLILSNVSILEINQDRTYIEIFDPSVAIGLTNNAALQPIVEEACRRLSVALASLTEIREKLPREEADPAPAT